MLASDLNNPEFQGAIDPNTRLHVEFYMHEPENGNQPWVLGKPVRMPAIPYVRIMVPGDKNSIVETPVRDKHKAEFPAKWLHFQMQCGLIDGGQDLPGFKVDEWDYLNPDQKRDLKYLRFYTVEQIAGASDAQVQKLGMGGMSLREQAKSAMRERMGGETRDALAAKDAQISDMQARLERMEAFLMAPKEPQVAQPAMAATVVSGAPTETIVTTPAPSERDELAKKYAAKFGKKPHHKLGVAKLKEALGE